MAVEAVDLDLRQIPPYTAVVWSQFESNPRLLYNLFEPNVGAGQNYQSDKVFDLSGAKHNHNISELKVEDVEDLHRLTRDLLRMPLLFRVKVEHTKTDHYVVMKIRKRWRDEFAILVNTQHPQIREILSRRLSEAMQYMQEGKKFCIKIGFGHSVRQWYSGIVDSEVTLCDSRSNDDDGHMSIYIHNYSTPLDCCVQPLCIFFCFPFWLLCGGPCYLTNRKIKCTDVEEHVTDLPVTMVSGHRTIVIEQRQQRPGQNVQLAGYPPQPVGFNGGPPPGQYNGPQGPYYGQPGRQLGPYPGPMESPPPYSAT